MARDAQSGALLQDAVYVEGEQGSPPLAATKTVPAMHEFSIMSYLLEAVEEQARQLQARKVLAINLVLGERAGIDDSLLFYFDAMTPGTLAEGAQLNIRRTAMRFHCDGCASDYKPTGADFCCPTCGQVGRLTDSADDLLIESIEIAT